MLYKCNVFNITIKTAQFGLLANWLESLVRRYGRRPFSAVTITAAPPCWADIENLLPFIEVCSATGQELVGQEHLRRLWACGPTEMSNSAFETVKKNVTSIRWALEQAYSMARRGHLAGATEEEIEEEFAGWIERKFGPRTPKRCRREALERRIKREASART